MRKIILIFLLVATWLFPTPVLAKSYADYVKEVDRCIGNKTLDRLDAATLDCLARNAKDFAQMRLQDVRELLLPLKDLLSSNANQITDEVFLSDGTSPIVSVDVLHIFVASLDDLLLVPLNEGPWQSFGEFEPNAVGIWDVRFDSSTLIPGTVYQVAYSFETDPRLLDSNDDSSSPFGISTLVTASIPEPSTSVSMLFGLVSLLAFFRLTKVKS